MYSIMTRTLFVSALLWFGTPCLAHDFWMEPLTFHPKVGEVVSIRLLVGEHFFGDRVGRFSDQIERFSAVGPGGEVETVGHEGHDPAGHFRIVIPGLYTLVYKSNPQEITLEARKFEAYLRMEGLEGISKLRAEKGETDKPGREQFVRCAKALIAAGDASPEGFDRKVSLPLEIVQESPPIEIEQGRTGRFRLLYEGEPLEGALVVALNKKVKEARQSKRSDEEGRVTFETAHSGVWMIKSVHMVPCKKEDVDWESYWGSFVFEVGEGAVGSGE